MSSEDPTVAAHDATNLSKSDRRSRKFVYFLLLGFHLAVASVLLIVMVLAVPLLSRAVDDFAVDLPVITRFVAALSRHCVPYWPLDLAFWMAGNALVLAVLLFWSPLGTRWATLYSAAIFCLAVLLFGMTLVGFAIPLFELMDSLQ
ncbi:hypothetical protein [Blastopirellula marina]|uniref:Uncharacterized protein n=1 Tax=Blastopirellula marina TaxID=124 RepID=A0A2S8GU66_9BACT|nr:hypothetical protein [Blastopirellula marina]PQO47950.1 hypothetical protein C5Y93_00760 [Blastopirellula marina]